MGKHLQVFNQASQGLNHMKKRATIQKIVDATRQLQERFQEVENRSWTIETYVMELLAEAGTLADSIVIQEGYRLLRPNQTIDLRDDIADVLFVLIMIANHYGVSLEDAYISMLRETAEKLGTHMDSHGSA
jgi:NTP pyrophosphatase (non-canonical NTP hydrolase)